MLPHINGEFRLGSEPELRFSPSGVAVCKVRAAASSRKKDESGQWVDDKTTWVRLVAFKQMAENIAESLQQGDLVVVTGRLVVEDYETSDGTKGRSVEILLDSIGPALNFNSVTVNRSKRGSSSAPAEDPWTTPSTKTGDPWVSPGTTGAGEAPPF